MCQFIRDLVRTIKWKLVKEMNKCGKVGVAGQTIQLEMETHFSRIMLLVYGIWQSNDAALRRPNKKR